MRELCTINVREHHQLKLRRLDKYVRCAGADGGGAGDYARTTAWYRERQRAYEASQGFRGRAGWRPAGTCRA